MNYLFVFATIEEAIPTIDLLAARPTALCKWLYEWNKGFLIITGIGSFSSFICLNAISEQIDMIHNFGVAGALQQTLELGTIHTISKCSKLLWHPKGVEATKETAAFDVCSEVCLEAKKGTSLVSSLVSSDFPVYAEKDVAALSKNFDLVDMEGYAVAFFARMQKKPCQLHKVVSDYCNASSPSLIKQGLKKHSEKIAQFIDNDLK